MTVANSYNPQIKDLIPVDKLPESIANLIGDITEGIFYKDYFFESSLSGDAGYHKLTIVLYKKLGLNIGGDSGMSLLLNPGHTTGTTEIPVSLTYRWELLKYAKAFNPEDLLSDPLVFFNLLWEMVGPEDFELIDSSINVFYGDSSTPINDFVTAFNDNTEITATLTVPSTTGLDAAKDIVTQMEAQAVDPKNYIIDYLITGENNGDSVDNASLLFNQWLGAIGIDNLIDLATPKFKAAIDTLELGIGFPTWMLKPLDGPASDPSSEVEEDKQSLLTIDIASLSFSSEEGMVFDIGSNPAELTPSQIGDTPMRIQIDGAEIDLREDTNIQAADDDERPKSFKGIFIEEALVYLPWAKTTGTANIIAQNVLIGSEGGFSGKIGIEEAVFEHYVDFEIETTSDISYDSDTKEITVTGTNEDETEIIILEGTETFIRDIEDHYYKVEDDGSITTATPPADLFTYNITDKISVSLDSLFLTFKKNSLVKSNIIGKLTLPFLSQPIKIKVDIGNGYSIEASFPKGKAIVDNNKVKVTLNSLLVSKIDDVKSFGFSGSLVVNSADPFSKKFLPDTVEVKNLVFSSNGQILFDVGIGWKNGTKISGNQDSGLEIIIPIHKKSDDKDKKLLKIDKIRINAKVDDDELKIRTTLMGAALNIAALTASAEGLGFEAVVNFPENGGQLGLGDVELKFVPPTEVGLSIETSTIIGGGYLKIDPEGHSYAGVLELKVVDKVTIRVLGLLNTRLPGGKKGYSLLMLVFVEDFKPISLGYGFTLNGVGGLLGLNRTANTEKLRSAVRSDDLQSTLFPQDVVKNANHIISNLEQFYPASEGRFLVGPMAKIGWGAPKSFITVDLGIIIELPAPVTIVILGVIKAVLPDAEVPVAIIKLNINFLGVIDFGKKSISFDASLYDSTYYMLAVSGDMAFRLIWGDKPAFLLTVGGFNPQFTPPPLNLPDIRRLTVCLVDKPELKLKLETYLAITSNTVQTGARLIALAEEGGFTANAMFWFDVLIQFNPFYLIANVGASAVIRAGGTVLLTAYLDLTLTGPKPWTVRGRVEFKALFIKSCINVNARWGEEANPTIPNKPIWPELEAAINDVNNWLALLPKRNNISVSVKNVALAAGEVLIHPMGNFSFNQTILPMNATINKYGSVKPSDYKKFWVVSVKDANENALDFTYQKDNFAPAQYTQMSDQEKLSKKSFEQFDSGIKVGTEALKSSHWVKRDVSHEEKIIDRRMKPSVTSSRDVPLDLFNTMLLHGDVANAPQSPVKNRLPYDAPATSSVNTNQYKVAVKDTMVSYDSTTFDSIASANQYLNSVVNANQTQENKLFVVETCEL